MYMDQTSEEIYPDVDLPTESELLDLLLDIEFFMVDLHMEELSPKLRSRLEFLTGELRSIVSVQHLH